MCTKAVDMVTIGKCKSCIMDVIWVDSQNVEMKSKLRDYGINAVPSIVIDGRIKVVGVPDFPWFCGEEFYEFLEEKYPLKVK